jgi:histidyl-tRNA synthetase
VDKIFGTTDSQTIGDIFRAIDKIQKKRKDEIIAEYVQKGYAKEKLEKILEFSKIKGSPEEIESAFDVKEISAWTELKELFLSLKNRGVSNIRVNFGIVRGLDYYSGVVFEAFDSSSNFGALVGGGRYDSLPKAFGRDDMGATGVAGGVERIILSLDSQGMQTIESTNLISVLFVNEEMVKPAMNIASRLRDKGLAVDIDLVGRPFKKQMENASSSKFSVIVAPKEFSTGQVIIKNMSDGKETIASVDSLFSNTKSLFTL